MLRSPQRSGQPTEPFVVGFAAHVQSVPETRRAFVTWMRAARIDAETVEDLEVVYSEVAANAVAASPDPGDEVRVRAHLDDTVLVLEVSNCTADADRLPIVTPDLDDPLRPNGRGLLIARAFVDSVEIEAEGPDRLVVRCCRRVARTA